MTLFSETKYSSKYLDTTSDGAGLCLGYTPFGFVGTKFQSLPNHKPHNMTNTSQTCKIRHYIRTNTAKNIASAN